MGSSTSTSPFTTPLFFSLTAGGAVERGPAGDREAGPSAPSAKSGKMKGCQSPAPTTVSLGGLPHNTPFWGSSVPLFRRE